MAIGKKELFPRGILIVVTVVLLSVSFAISRHVVPQGLRQVITLDHQIRRVLWRAERENLRSSVSIQKASVMINLPLGLGKFFPSPDAAVRRYRIPLVWETHIESKNFIAELSPVLNL